MQDWGLKSFNKSACHIHWYTPVIWHGAPIQKIKEAIQSLCDRIWLFFFISVQLLDTIGEKKKKKISESGSTTLNATLKVFE